MSKVRCVRSFALFDCSFGNLVGRLLRGLAVAGAVMGLQMAWDAATATVSAQGFFSNLFGPSPSPPPRYLPPPRIQVTPVALPKPQISTPPRETRSAPQSSGYRTMCVRLCDGYYWPISNSTSRSRFAHDAEMCSSSCQSDSKLFYASANGDPADMVDLQGRAYSKLPTAFKYRKAMDDSCRCKPRPWDKTEVERHRRYAETEAARNASNIPQQPVKEAEAKPVEPTSTQPPAADQLTDPEVKNEPVVTAETAADPTEAKVTPPAPATPARPEPQRKRSPLQALIEEHRRQTRANVTVTYVRKPTNGSANVARKLQ